MTSSFSFNLHDLVRATVRGPEWLVSPVRSELIHYISTDHETAGELDLIVDLGYSGKPFPQDFSGTGWHGSHLIASWKAGMEMPERSPARLVFRGNRASRFIVSKWIVEPAFRTLVEIKGNIMVHAATLSDGEKAVLVAGAGGAGKTTMALSWLSSGHPYMSDDFSVISSATSLPYITPMRIGVRNLVSNTILQKLPVSSKLEILFRTAVRQASLGKVKFYFKRTIQQIDPLIKISDSAPIAGAIVLACPQTSDAGESRSIQPQELADLMTKIDNEEMHKFGQGMLDKDFRESHRKKLIKLFQDKPAIVVHGAPSPSEKDLVSVDALLEWARSR